jgi:hypothetical protein
MTLILILHSNLLFNILVQNIFKHKTTIHSILLTKINFTKSIFITAEPNIHEINNDKIAKVQNPKKKREIHEPE